MSSSEEKIQNQISNNPVLLYMKGTPEAPECGFSKATVAVLKKTRHPFSYVNVLAAPFIREKLPKVSNWPTFPQLFIKGKLIGGCDIVLEMDAEGSLKTLLDDAAESADTTTLEQS